MKKWLTILAIFVLICALVFAYLYFKPIEVNAFNLADYNAPISHFPSDEVLGKVTSAKDAVKKAKEMFEKVFYNDYGRCLVFYDSSTQTYLVTGTLPRGVDGGVPYMIIEEKSGKVLAIWHDS